MITILFIVGKAGVGKDTASAYLSKKNGWNVIHSYTNRPMREGETQGLEHIFVDHCAPSDAFAYTHYGEYDYWTEFSQFKHDTINVYVIDEVGIIKAQEKAKEAGNIKLFGLYISASKDKRSERGVDNSRMDRDKTRISCDYKYQFTIENNGEISDFYKSLDDIKL